MSQFVTGAAILLAVRTHPEITWTHLCEHFGLRADHVESLQYSLAMQVKALVDAGLIIRSPDGNDPPAPHTRFAVSSAWPGVQGALGVSLEEMARLRRGKTLVARPYFGAPASLGSAPGVFVLMPFAPAMKPIYDDHISVVARRLGLSAVRADDFYFARAIITDIWAAICAARVIIADCTDRNPNVFYEIGLAHAIGKPVLLITRNIEDVPFDLRHLRYLQYEYTPRGMTVFESHLEEMLRLELASGQDALA